MKIVYLICAFLLGVGSASAQSSYESYGLHTTSNGNLWINVPGGSELTEKKVIGPSGYFYDEYLAGEIFTNSDQVTPVQQMRFRVETNELEAVVDTKKLFYTPEFILGFSLQAEGNKHIFIKVWNPDTEVFEFMEVLKSKHNSMVLHHRAIAYKEGDFNPALSIGTQDKFIEKNTYYIRINDTTFRLPRGKSKVLALFGEKASMVSDYADKNGLSFNKPENVLSMASYYLELN